MRNQWLPTIVCLAIIVLRAAAGHAEPLQFRWPTPATARVTQATIDDFGNFSLRFDLSVERAAGGAAIKVSAGGYRLLYHNRLLLQGPKLDGFDMLGILHRLTIPTYLIDRSGRLLRADPADPREIETAFLQNVSGARAAALRQWFVARRPGDFAEVRRRSAAYWQVQIPYWEYWIGKWQSLFGSEAANPDRRQELYLAGLRLPGTTRVIERSPAPDCQTCIAVAAEDRFSHADLAPHLEELSAQLGLARGPDETKAKAMRAFVRTEAIVDWKTMLPYRVQAMTIAFQDLADGQVVAYDQTKHFYFEWRNTQTAGNTE